MTAITEMQSAPLISASALLDIYEDADVGIVDCRFALDDTERGRHDWAAACIPGARYAHLDEDLSGAIGEGERGRHPLPSPSHVDALRASWGFDEDTLIVCYDDAGGPFAARLWWMLRWIDHPMVAVLDGGWQAWLKCAGPTAPGVTSDECLLEARHPSKKTSADSAGCATTSPGVTAVNEMLAAHEDMLQDGVQAVDARARERYLGHDEPIDPVAGHIPGAINMPWMENLDAEGRFLSANQLRLKWNDIPESKDVVCYCGSGVTACHNILAAAVAGRPFPRLYALSWSGWIHDPGRPIERDESSD